MSNKLYYSLYTIAVILSYVWLGTVMGFVDALPISAIAATVCLPIVIVAKGFAEAVVSAL